MNGNKGELVQIVSTKVEKIVSFFFFKSNLATLKEIFRDLINSLMLKLKDF